MSINFKHTRLFFSSCILLLVALSCKKEEDITDPTPNPIVLNIQDGIFTVNEGIDQSDNASVGFIARVSVDVEHTIFAKATNQPLGDMAHSICRDDQDVYIIVSNSRKIEKMRLPDFTHTCTITGMYAPRFMLKVGDNKAYVSDKIAKAIHIVNMDNCQITGSIPTGGWTEEMLLYDSLVYVAQQGTDKVLRINPYTDQLVDSAYVASRPMSMQIDANGKLWVLCAGDGQTYIPRMKRVSTETMITEVDMPFTSFSEYPKRLKINTAGDMLYFLNNQGLYRMSMDDVARPFQPWIANEGRNLYGLGIDPINGEVYVSDARGTSQSMTYRYTPQAVLLDSVVTGINTRDFHFLD